MKNIVEIIVRSGLVKTQQNARRLVEQGAIKVNGKKVLTCAQEFMDGEVINLNVGAKKPMCISDF